MWRVGSTDIFRTFETTDGRPDPLDSGCFPLIPFANRIANASLSFDGEEYPLIADPIAEPHAIHGTSWRDDWRIVDKADDCLAMAYRHDGPGWPWTFTARQRLCLSPDELSVELSVTNETSTEMPAGIGLHPYFALASEADIEVAADGVILASADGVPTGQGPYPEALPSHPDNCLTGWSRTTAINWPRHRLTITADPVFRYLHFYRPDDGETLCLEPVSHRPNDVDDMTTLSPGATLSGTISFTLS